jgi:acyl-CoA synthetase (AMP-forming)/AMP-acid ligase II/acyl carrier protein
MATALVPDLLRLRARERPHHVALVVEGGESLTYEDWQRRSSGVARGLAGLGVIRGDRVGLCFDNAAWTDYAVCYLAVQKAGAVAVPLAPRFSARELTRFVEHAGIELLICSAELLRGLPPMPGCEVVDPRELEAGTGEADFQAPVAADDLAEIIYTSGTTAAPKGVAVTHASVLAHDLPAAPAGEASFLHAFPLATNAGQECLRMPLRRTTTAVVMRSFDALRLCEVVAGRRIRRLQLVPAMAQVLVFSGATEHFDLSCVDRVTLSSAPAPAALWAQLRMAFPAAELFNAYSLTESGGARTLMRHDPARPRSVGRPVGETELRVVDETGIEVPRGETGEVWLRRRGAPQRHYYRDPVATAAAFAGGWLRTGDIGFLDADGYLHLVDRKKDVIISGGLNVSSLEVEEALYEHPAVLEAAVFGVPHEFLGEDVAAAIVAGSPVAARELQAFVRARLGEHKVPHRIFFVTSLPRNASGKVVKRELRGRFAAPPNAGPPAAPAAPHGGIEAAVLAVWREVLARADFGLGEDFFDLGGHSLAAAQVVSRLRDLFAVELPVTAVFDHPTVVELAAAVQDAAALASSP